MGSFEESRSSQTPRCLLSRSGQEGVRPAPDREGRKGGVGVDGEERGSCLDCRVRGITNHTSYHGDVCLISLPHLLSRSCVLIAK